MELFYLSPQGEEISWLVSEVIPEQSYRIVDQNGQSNPQGVNHSEGKSTTIVFFDGFIIENDKVYATALLTRSPKIELGHSPRITQ